MLAAVKGQGARPASARRGGVSRRSTLGASAREKIMTARARAPESRKLRMKNSATSCFTPMAANTIENSTCSSSRRACLTIWAETRSCGRPLPEKIGSFWPAHQRVHSVNGRQARLDEFTWITARIGIDREPVDVAAIRGKARVVHRRRDGPSHRTRGPTSAAKPASGSSPPGNARAGSGSRAPLFLSRTCTTACVSEMSSTRPKRGRPPGSRISNHFVIANVAGTFHHPRAALRCAWHRCIAVRDPGYRSRSWAIFMKRFEPDFLRQRLRVRP